METVVVSLGAVVNNISTEEYTECIAGFPNGVYEKKLKRSKGTL